MPKLTIDGALAIANSIPALIALIRSIKNGEQPVVDPTDAHQLTPSEVNAKFETVSWLQQGVSDDIVERLGGPQTPPTPPTPATPAGGGH